MSQALFHAARRVAGAAKRGPKLALRRLRAGALQRDVEAAWAKTGKPGQRPHTLPGSLIVSLTSHRARFATLAPTLKCLLRQTMAPDALILWVGHDDLACVPDDVRALRAYGLHIAGARDLRSYTKIIPTLAEAPDAFIVTADDDLYYPETWLEELVAAHRAQNEILAHRAHRIRLRDGAPAPYASWRQNWPEESASPLLFATGVGGVLYPPQALHRDVMDATSFTSLCPHADDVWLYFMARRAGSVVRKIGPPRETISWPGSQDVALLKHNVGPAHGNDAQIANLIGRYGFPPRP